MNWISVKDRLPDYNKDFKSKRKTPQYLCCGIGGWILVLWYHPKIGWYDESDYYIVTHWQPLPEPPK